MGEDDAEQDGDQVYAIELATAVSIDQGYNGLDAADVSVTNLKNELPPPTLSIDDVTVTEGESGTTTTVTFTVSRSGDPSVPGSVDYETQNDSAMAPEDYVDIALDTLMFPAGADHDDRQRYRQWRYAGRG